MALKITTQIGTDKGITSEAYVRISDYRISKYGNAAFRVELYMSENDIPGLGRNPSPTMGTARNQQIGENLYSPMTKEVSNTTIVKQMVPIQVEREVSTGSNDADGNPIMETRIVTEMQEQDVEQTTVSIVPDMSQAEDVDIFAFGYGKLKAKLQDLFGEANVVDC